MDLFEDTAQLYETAETEKERRRFGDRYMRMIGVEPELRHELRPMLEDIKAGAWVSVADAIAGLRKRYANGLDVGAGRDTSIVGGGNDLCR